MYPAGICVFKSSTAARFLLMIRSKIMADGAPVSVSSAATFSLLLDGGIRGAPSAAGKTSLVVVTAR